MKKLSVKNFVLLSTALSFLPRPGYGTPTAQTNQVGSSNDQPVEGGPTYGPLHQLEEAGITTDDDEDHTSVVPKDQVGVLGARWINPLDDVPKIPPPPPLPPAPRPPAVPAPVGPAEIPSSADNPLRPAAPNPANPPSPPRVDPPPNTNPDWKPIPAGESPGAGTGVRDDSSPPLSMDEYEQRGAQAFTDYQQLRNHGPDTPIVRTPQELGQYPNNKAFLDYTVNTDYQTEATSLRSDQIPTFKDWKSDDVGFKMNSNPAYWVDRKTVTPEGHANQANMIVQNLYDRQGRFIVYENAFKQRQNDITGTRVPLNEISMQNFLTVAGSNAKNLKAAFCTNIQNSDFWGITRQNYNDLKQPFSQVMTFQSGTKQFNRFLGSPNMRSRLYSYGNHHNAIGDKVIDKIVIIPKAAQSPEAGASNGLMAVLVFKDPS